MFQKTKDFFSRAKQAFLDDFAPYCLLLLIAAGVVATVVCSNADHRITRDVIRAEVYSGLRAAGGAETSLQNGIIRIEVTLDQMGKRLAELEASKTRPVVPSTFAPDHMEIMKNLNSTDPAERMRGVKAAEAKHAGPAREKPVRELKTTDIPMYNPDD